MLLRFIGKNGSMGLITGQGYECQISTRGNYIYVSWHTGMMTMDCLYESIKALSENWEAYSVASVKDDVTFSDIYNTGFSAGAHFTFFMLRNKIKACMTEEDIVKLAHWFELKNGDVHNFQEWYELMIRALCLDEGGFNEQR